MARKGYVPDINKWVEEELEITFDVNGLPKFTTKSGRVYCIRCGRYVGKLKPGEYIADPQVQIRLLCEECRKIMVEQVKAERLVSRQN